MQSRLYAVNGKFNAPPILLLLVTRENCQNEQAPDGSTGARVCAAPLPLTRMSGDRNSCCAILGRVASLLSGVFAAQSSLGGKGRGVQRKVLFARLRCLLNSPHPFDL